MAMILEPFISKFCKLLADYVGDEVTLLLGVKDELQKLLDRMRSIQCLLQDAEKRRFDDSESSTELWLSKLKDVMYDADDIIDLCRIEGSQLLAAQNLQSQLLADQNLQSQLLADQNPQSRTSRVCCNFSSLFECFSGIPLLHEIGNRIKRNYDRLDITTVPLRHDIGNRIKEINDRLNQIYEDRVRYKLEISARLETLRITQVDRRQTSPVIDPLAMGKEVVDAANKLIDRLVTENIKEKCLLFAITGMGGIGKTTLAQKIFNHESIKNNFKLKVWVCISQTYTEIELLKQIIRGAEGRYGDSSTKAELLPRLRDSVASGGSLLLVLDDAWRADVWVHLLKDPLCNPNTTVRVLITTRDENIARGMDAAYIHPMQLLSTESGWDMLRRSVFHNGEEEQANELKNLGFEIVKKCGHLPLAIKAIAGVLKKEITKKAWVNILSNKAWSISKLPEELRGALYLSFEDLPSHLKQCFLYFSLYPEDANIDRDEVIRYWVAEGFITEEEENSIMEDVAEKYFNELVERNLLQPCLHKYGMHDLIRSLALFLSKEESSYENENVKDAATSTKLRRLSLGQRHRLKSVPSAQILALIANQGGLRTLLASFSDLLLDHERLMQLSRLRLLDISQTGIEILPDSIGSLVHLRYLNLSFSDITTIPESIKHLAYLQFLIIVWCKKLTQLPRGIIQLGNLRCLDLYATPISFIPKGIGKLKQLNELSGFVVDNNDSSSQLEELNSLNQIRKLSIRKLEGAKSGAKILGELSYLSDLTLDFTKHDLERNMEEQLAVEKLFDELTPPPSLEMLVVWHFFGSRFPCWMALSTFESCVSHLTELHLNEITKCTQLPPLGQMPELKFLYIQRVYKVKKIGPEFLGGGVISVVDSSTRIVFPKLQKLEIVGMPELEEFSFGAEVEENASPRLKLLPCLRELCIYSCPLLKQLPKGLKHSDMKSLEITIANSLESLDDLPVEIEKLYISCCNKLETVCSLPALNTLWVQSCDALSCLGNLDSLQHLIYNDNIDKQSLPEWLLMLLQRVQRLQNDSNENFKLDLQCSKKVLQECLEGGSYWDLIRHIPQVNANDRYPRKGYFRYNKQLHVYDTNL